MEAKSDDSVIVRAAYRKYYIVGFWVILAIVLYIISLRPVPIEPNIKIPRIHYDVLAFFALVLALSWLFWLRSLKITVSDRYMEYRNGFYHFKASLKTIENVQDEYVPMGEILRQGRLPKFIVKLKGGNGLSFKTDPFRREDLFKMFLALKKAGAWKRHDYRINSIWGGRLF